MTFDRWPFSQPYGPAHLYDAPPYPYRDARTISTLVTLDAEAVLPHLPPGVEVDREECLGVMAASDYPESGLGAYRELSFFVRATFGGQPFMYSPLMYADGDRAITAGRELWGFAKKSAVMNMADDAHSWHFTVERGGRPIADLQFRPGDQRSPQEMALVDFPTLTLRLIPSLVGHGAPDIAQLVSTNNVKRPHADAIGPLRWAGEADWVLSDAPPDPLGAFRPTSVLSSWMTVYDCDLPAGQLIHDYVHGD